MVLDHRGRCRAVLLIEFVLSLAAIVFSPFLTVARLVKPYGNSIAVKWYQCHHPNGLSKGLVAGMEHHRTMCKTPKVLALVTACVRLWTPSLP